MEVRVNKRDIFSFANDPVLPILEEVFGKRYSRSSCLYSNHYTFFENAEYKMRAFLAAAPIKVAVEIGTLFGVGAAMLANYADEVYTIDIKSYYEPHILWIQTGCREKIKQCIIKNEYEKIELLDDLEFDFAFVDGLHTYDGVKTDFDNVKKCGRVLLHDYFSEEHTLDGKEFDEIRQRDPDNWLVGVKRLVDELPQDEVTIDEPFAYWEKKC